MLSVTIEPQKIRISRAPARAKRSDVTGAEAGHEGAGEVGRVRRHETPGGPEPDRGQEAEDEGWVDGDRHLHRAEPDRDAVPVPGSR